MTGEESSFTTVRVETPNLEAAASPVLAPGTQWMGFLVLPCELMTARDTTNRQC